MATPHTYEYMQTHVDNCIFGFLIIRFGHHNSLDGDDEDVQEWNN